MVMFGDPDYTQEIETILDNYSIEEVLEKLEIDSKEVLRILAFNGYDILPVYEEIINGG